MNKLNPWSAISPQEFNNKFPGILIKSNRDLISTILNVSRDLLVDSETFCKHDTFCIAINKDIYGEIYLLELFKFLGIRIKEKRIAKECQCKH